MAIDRNKPEALLKQLADELQNGEHQPAESLHRSDNNSTGSETTPVRSFFGLWDSGDPRSADNDRIDADLVREYASSHEADS